MTLNEFKAWLEGFEEAIDGAPDEKQWRKIKVKLSSVTGAKEINIHHHDHSNPYRPHYPHWYYSTTAGIQTTLTTTNDNMQTVSWYEQGKLDATT